MYEYRAQVVEPAHDGDTIRCDVDQGFDVWHRRMSLRLLRINAPEIRVADPAGAAARDFLRGLCPVGAFVLVRTDHDQPDKYGGRWDAELFIGHWIGDVLTQAVNVNDLMVSSGHAVYKAYAATSHLFSLRGTAVEQ